MELSTMMQAVDLYRKGERDVIDDMAAALEKLWPKGSVPRAMETPAHGQRVWYFDLGGDTVHESSIKVRDNMPLVCVYGSDDYWDTITPGGTPVFETEAEARLALHWQKLHELIAAAAFPQEAGRSIPFNSSSIRSKFRSIP